VVTIFHLSDLHIVISAQWNNLRACILDEAERVGRARGEGEKLLVVTGDFHNFWEGGYDKAKAFLEELIAALGIDPAQDVFVVPGNHDVGSRAAMARFFPDGSDWDLRQEASVAWLKANRSAAPNYARHVDMRLASYTPYCDFVRTLGVYPGDSGRRAASVHVRCWRGSLNLFHLNTTLIADGTSKTAQQADVLTATGEDVWAGVPKDLPALALGHNSFFDLDASQQIALAAPFKLHNVCAYLCGDTHAEETDRHRQMIRLESGHYGGAAIPNVVCVKGAADEGDTFSDFGLYLHEWDEREERVSLRLLRWKPDRDQVRFFCEDDGDHYYIPRLEDDLARLRAELKALEGPEPPDTAREERARALLADGKTDEALALLSDPKRGETLKRKTAAAEDAVRQYISEDLLRIKLLKEPGLSRENIPAVRACYEDCVALAKKHRVCVYVLYDYVRFLRHLHDYTPATETAQWLLSYYQQEGVPEEQQAALKNMLGILLKSTNRLDEAEELYREALAVRRALAENDPAAYKPDLAVTCNNLAILLKNTNRTEEAEAFYREALDIRLELAGADPAYRTALGTTYNNLGVLFEDTNRPREAEDAYRRALDIRRTLAETGPASYRSSLATTYNNLGSLFLKTGRLDEAEEFSREALSIRRRLAEANPAAYEPNLAVTCNNLASLLKKTGRLEEAEDLFREALDLRRRLAKANPDAYESALARTCNNLGALLEKAGRTDEAEKLYREALDIRRALAKANPDAYEAALAVTCGNLGALLEDTGRAEEAEQLFREALTIRRRLAEVNPAVYGSAFASTCNHLASLLKNADRAEEAEEYSREAWSVCGEPDPDTHGGTPS